MKAFSFLLNKEAVVIIENEHKEIETYGKEVNWNFTSFEQALRWAKKEVYNGGIFTTT